MDQSLDPLIADLLTLADEIPAPNDFALHQYWMRFDRKGSDLAVTLIIDDFAKSAAIIVRSKDVDVATVRISSIAAVRVLDSARRVIEVCGGGSSGQAIRCVLAIDTGAVVDVNYDESSEATPWLERFGC